MNALRFAVLACALAASCGGSPSPGASHPVRPATPEEMRALVRPQLSSASARAQAPGTLARRPAPPSSMVVSYLGADGRWHVGCADSEEAAARLATQVKERQ